MGLRDYIRVLRRSWLLLVAMVVIGTCAGLAYTYFSPATYQSTAVVFVSTQGATSAQDLSQSSTYGQSVVRDYAGLAVTPLVLDPVIKELNLSDTPAQLATRITADSPAKTSLLQITVTDGSRTGAADIANAVTRSLTSVAPQVSPSGASTTTGVKLTTAQPAVAPLLPVSPVPVLDTGIGLLVGLVLGLIIAILRDVLDTRIRTEPDVALVTDAPILGAIRFDPQARSRPLVVQTDPHSLRAESFRSLRTNLQFVGMRRSGRVLIVTSSLPGEGKSTTAANVAITLAEAGERVALVEGDLRRPKLATYLGLEDGVGLTDVLIGSVELDQAIQRWGAKDLAVLSSGNLPPNPSELLQSQEMKDVFAKLRDEFDVVIVDAPPLLPVSDAAVLAQEASGAIIVTAARKATRGQLRQALSVLERVEANVLGIVLTMVPDRGPDAHAYGNAGYYAARPASSTN